MVTMIVWPNPNLDLVSIVKDFFYVYSAICVNPCAHGSCVGPDTCSCDAGWEGALCDSGIHASLCLKLMVAFLVNFDFS